MAEDYMIERKTKKQKSWQEKLEDNKGLPKVEKITEKMSKRWGSGTVVIPAPKEVDEIMRRVGEGELITINQIREILARRYKATIGCPMTTGIFAWIAAHAAEEARRDGKKDITPYWRTLKSTGELNTKYPGGLKGQAKNLRKEGHVIEYRKGKKEVIVRDFEKYLVKV